VHCSRTTQQFEQLLKLMLQHWRDVLAENDFADWFAAEYGKEPWKNWHITVSGIPGLIGNIKVKNHSIEM